MSLCAFDAAGTDVGGPLAPAASKFMVCMDSSGQLPPIYDLSIPQRCAESAGLEWAAVISCYGGARGAELLKAAAAEEKRVFGDKGFGSVPKVIVDGKAVCPFRDPAGQYTPCDYDIVAKAISGAGPDRAAPAAL